MTAQLVTGALDHGHLASQQAVRSLATEDASFLDRMRAAFRPSQLERLSDALRRHDGAAARAVVEQALSLELVGEGVTG